MNLEAPTMDFPDDTPPPAPLTLVEVLTLRVPYEEFAATLGAARRRRGRRAGPRARRGAGPRPRATHRRLDANSSGRKSNLE